MQPLPCSWRLLNFHSLFFPSSSSCWPCKTYTYSIKDELQDYWDMCVKLHWLNRSHCFVWLLLHVSYSQQFTWRRRARLCMLWVAQLFEREINKRMSTNCFIVLHVGKLTVCVWLHVGLTSGWTFPAAVNWRKAHISTSTCHKKLLSDTRAHCLSHTSHHCNRPLHKLL
jgi:hypothetical protein